MVNTFLIKLAIALFNLIGSISGAIGVLVLGILGDYYDVKNNVEKIKFPELRSLKSSKKL